MMEKREERAKPAPFLKKRRKLGGEIGVSEYTYRSKKLPVLFSGKRIVQLSDVHNADFSKKEKPLEEVVRECAPDIIVITGDLVDRRHFSLLNAKKLIAGIAPLAPIYFVPGNHEAWSNRYPEVREMLFCYGVHVLDDEKCFWKIGKEQIVIAGIRDPGFLSRRRGKKATAVSYPKGVFHLLSDDEFTLLLAHRPEYIELYREAGADLTFSGHAHGGQMRLSFAKDGIFAPEQGFFPKYTNGLHEKRKQAMVISRGLGPLHFPPRINNPPEVVCVTLLHE